MRLGGDFVVARVEVEGRPRLKIGNEERVFVVLARTPDVGQRENPRHDPAITGRRLR